MALLLAGCTAKAPYTKSPEGLTIRLGGGKTVELRDKPGSSQDMDVAVHEYRRYLPEIRKHVVLVQGYEGYAHLLIDDATAARTIIAGEPVVSPDRAWLACAVSNLVLSFAAVEIWRVDGDRLTRVLKADEDHFPGEPEWIDAATVRIGVKDIDGRPLGRRTFPWDGKAWVETK